jgi:hypothetical protein
MLIIVEACKENMFKCHIILFPATLISMCNMLQPIVRGWKREQEGKREMLWMGQGKHVSYFSSQKLELIWGLN